MVLQSRAAVKHKLDESFNYRRAGVMAYDRGAHNWPGPFQHAFCLRSSPRCAIEL
jgi:hypothetical protein